MKHETKYIFDGKDVIEAVHIIDDVYVRPRDIINSTPDNVFESKKEALYARVLTRIKKGVPYTNFKVSKYYEYYIERLEKEHPELLI